MQSFATGGNQKLTLLKNERYSELPSPALSGSGSKGMISARKGTPVIIRHKGKKNAYQPTWCRFFLCCTIG